MLDKWRLLDELRQRIAYLRRVEMEKRNSAPERAEVYRERRRELELLIQQIEGGAYDQIMNSGHKNISRMTGETIVGGGMEEMRQGKPVSDSKRKRLRVLKVGRSGAAGMAFLSGSIGSWLLVEKVFSWDWYSLVYFIIGLVCYIEVKLRWN